MVQNKRKIPHTDIVCILHEEKNFFYAENYGSLQCGPGYEGNMCASCNRNKTNGPIFSLEEPFECAECNNAEIWVTGSVLATSFFIFLTTFFTMYSNQ